MDTSSSPRENLQRSGEYDSDKSEDEDQEESDSSQERYGQEDEEEDEEHDSKEDIDLTQTLDPEEEANLASLVSFLRELRTPIVSSRT